MRSTLELPNGFIEKSNQIFSGPQIPPLTTPLNILVFIVHPVTILSSAIQPLPYNLEKERGSSWLIGSFFDTGIPTI